ncbi:MAG: hypothetical protein AB2764_20195, partial [Candidatus Thiodiazotropha endolucinida]
FSTFIIAHLSKFVVNFNLIILSKAKYIVISTGLFCSIVGSGISHFYSLFFRKSLGKGFGMTTMVFGLGQNFIKDIFMKLGTKINHHQTMCRE